MKLAIRNTVGMGALWSAVALAGWALVPGAAADVLLSFDPLNGVIMEAVPAETLTVAVTVDAGADTLKGFSLVLEFDPTYVEPISVAPGALMTGGGCDAPFVAWQNAAAIGDSIAVDGAALGCLMVGTGDLLEIQFIGVPGQFGVSPLTCRDVRLRNQYNDVLPEICLLGTIEHRPVVISTAAETWGRVKALYR